MITTNAESRGKQFAFVKSKKNILETITGHVLHLVSGSRLATHTSNSH